MCGCDGFYVCPRCAGTLLGPEFAELIRLTDDDYSLSGKLREGGWLGFWGRGHAS